MESNVMTDPSRSPNVLVFHEGVRSEPADSERPPCPRARGMDRAHWRYLERVNPMRRMGWVRAARVTSTLLVLMCVSASCRDGLANSSAKQKAEE